MSKNDCINICRLHAVLQKEEKDQTNLSGFLKAQMWENKFLETEEGKKYMLLFSVLKIKYVSLECGGIHSEKLENDNIVPKEWLYKAYKEISLTTLAVNQKNDSGYGKSVSFYVL